MPLLMHLPELKVNQTGEKSLKSGWVFSKKAVRECIKGINNLNICTLCITNNINSLVFRRNTSFEIRTPFSFLPFSGSFPHLHQLKYLAELPKATLFIFRFSFLNYLRVPLSTRPGAEIGRQACLRGMCPIGREGSSPSPGTSWVKSEKRKTKS